MRARQHRDGGELSHTAAVQPRHTCGVHVTRCDFDRPSATAIHNVQAQVTVCIAPQRADIEPYGDCALK